MDQKTDDVLNIASLSITPEMLTLIAEIDERKGAWRAIGGIAPERLDLWERLKDLASSWPMWRNAAVTVRRPRAKIVPTRRNWTLYHVGLTYQS